MYYKIIAVVKYILKALGTRADSEYFRFAGYMVLVATTQLCHCSVKASTVIM